jgi:hypothetical protein
MGLSLTVKKEDNHLYTEFPNAYWRIEDIIITGGAVSFSLNTYPSRESALKGNEKVEESGSILYGGPTRIAYDGKIRSWSASFKAEDVFPTGIPTTETGMKDVLYELVKSYTGLNFEDVLEE